jgi:FKBP-type peptidyl-prolyl cis-trans isomerase FkpA
MKRLLATCLLAGLAAVGTTKAADPELKTADDKAVYALGAFLAARGQLNALALTPNEVAILQMGVSDEANEKPLKVDLEKSMADIQTFAAKRMPAAADARAIVEKKKGKAYLETVAAKPTVKKMGSGFYMETVAEGTGTSPVNSDTVKVNYKGSLVDGKVFDESAKAGVPSTFRVGQVVKCWQEALEYMKPGGKTKVYCPPELAYGDVWHGIDIPPGSTLVFELELLEIVKPDAPATK